MNAAVERRPVDRLSLTLGVLLAVAVVALFSVRPWRRSHVDWLRDAGAGFAAARRSGKPVFVEVGAEWCGPCHRMDRDTFAEPSVGAALAGYVPIRLDYDTPDGRKQYDRLGAVALPSFFVLSPDGAVVAQTAGYLSPDDFLAWIRRAKPAASAR